MYNRWSFFTKTQYHISFQHQLSRHTHLPHTHSPKVGAGLALPHLEAITEVEVLRLAVVGYHSTVTVDHHHNTDRNNHMMRLENRTLSPTSRKWMWDSNRVFYNMSFGNSWKTLTEYTGNFGSELRNVEVFRIYSLIALFRYIEA